MEVLKSIKRPTDINWDIWIDRWDQMQNRYVAMRSERFDKIVQLIEATQQPPKQILDIGCGPGSLSLRLLESFPETEIYCIDVDPTLLWIAEVLKKKYNNRIHIFQGDLRESSWTTHFSTSFDAIVSATALHWLDKAQLSELYRQINLLLDSGGIFVNADHVGCESSKIQYFWESNREQIRSEQTIVPGSDWDSFWADYAKTLGVDISKIRSPLFEDRVTGPEEGLPLSWHFDKLREAGFSTVECFLRYDCDAIYGGLKESD
jgi:cyclopropane fatty-acyl-phospholipid synthase-like methyltransferase